MICVICPSVIQTFYCLKGPFLSSGFFSIFPLFFSLEKQEKQEKQETCPKFGNLTEGKIFGRLRIPIFGDKKMEKIGNTYHRSLLKLINASYLMWAQNGSCTPEERSELDRVSMGRRARLKIDPQRSTRAGVALPVAPPALGARPSCFCVWIHRGFAVLRIRERLRTARYSSRTYVYVLV